MGNSLVINIGYGVLLCDPNDDNCDYDLYDYILNMVDEGEPDTEPFILESSGHRDYRGFLLVVEESNQWGQWSNVLTVPNNGISYYDSLFKNNIDMLKELFPSVDFSNPGWLAWATWG